MQNDIKPDILSKLNKLPSLPGATLDLVRSFNDEDINVAALAKKIGRDPLLTVRVLKVVNSPFYGLDGEVSSLPEAVMVLGFSNVRSLALAASLTGAFPMPPHGSSEARHLWMHSFCCAICAQLLAPRVQVDAETAFTAGLLHDIGRIAMLALCPTQFEEIMKLMTEQGVELEAAEERVLGFNHATFGARLLERWHLPTKLVQAAEFHHTPDTEPTSRLTDLINVSSIFAHACERHTLYQFLSTAPPNGAIMRLGLTRTQCADALETVDAQLASISAVLG